MLIRGIQFLHESQRILKEGPQGKVWRVVVIEQGWSKNNRYYPADVLRETASKFEGVRVYAYRFKPGHWDHLPDNARVVRSFAGNVVGWLSKPKFEKLPSGKSGVTADFHVADEKIRDLLKNSWEAGKKDFLGFSIDVEGEIISGVAEGKTGTLVTKIDEIRSLDVVSLPAAGGKLLRLVASQQGGDNMDPIKRIIAMFREDPSLLKGLKEDLNLESMSDKEVMNVLLEVLGKEAKKKMPKKGEKGYEEYIKKYGKAAEGEVSFDEAILAEVLVQPGVLNKVIEMLKAKKTSEAIEALEGLLSAYQKGKSAKKETESDDETKKKEAAAQAAADKKAADEKAAEEARTAEAKKKGEAQESAAEKRVKKLECKLTLKDKLAEAKLPEISKTRLQKRFAESIFEEKALVEAIDDEKDFLADLSKSGEVTGMKESEDVTVGMGKVDRMQAGLDILVLGDLTDEEKKKYDKVPRFMGIREAYSRFTGDKEVRGRLSEAILKEAVTTDFPQALGTSMERRMLRDYKELPQLWRDIFTIENIANFKQQDLIRWGGFGALSTVDEDDAYPEITKYSEEKASYSIDTYGGYFKITRRMIINDNLRALRRVPIKLARAASNTLNQYAFDIVTNYDSVGGINGGTVYTGGALYTSGQTNLSALAMSFDAVFAMRTAMVKQAELDSGEPIEIHPAHLIFPPDLYATAFSIIESDVKSGLNNDEKNPLYKKFKLMEVPKFLRDSNNYYMVADKKTIETFVIGFLNGRQTPEILVQDQPVNGEVFTHDRIRYKIRHEYAGASEDFRSTSAAIVAGS